MGRRLGPALASFLFALALAGCGDEKSSEGLTGSSSETGASPAPLPAQIVALTKQGDVVVIDRETRESRVIASFPPREDPQVEAGSFRAVDVTALPDGRFLVATCCEPAAGHMYALSEDGHRLKDQDIFAEDAGHDADSRVASGELVGLVIRPLSDLNSAAYTLAPPPDVSGFSPDNISWSAADDKSSSHRRERSASSTYPPIHSPMRRSWIRPMGRTGPAPPTRSRGQSRSSREATRCIRPGRAGSCVVDMDTGTSTELVSTKGRVTDLAADPTGSYLLWVEGGNLRWSVDDEGATLPGDFIAASWMSAA